MSIKPITGARPELIWVSPTSLMVDATYQRNLSKRSVNLIHKMIDGFAWNRMKPPIVVRVGGDLHIVDGQHTAIVAATLKIPEIPIFVVEAATVDERARAFVGHNTDRVTVSPFDIFRALVASGDPDAMDVDNVCKRAKVRIRQMNGNTVAAEGDTMALGIIRRMVLKQGVIKSRQVLETLVAAKRIPISAAEIQAVENVVCVLHPGIDLSRLARIIRIDGDSGLLSAHTHSKVATIPVWRALVERWKTKGLQNAA